MMRRMEPVTIEMFLDVSCPWCHGAVERNRRFLDELDADSEIPPIHVQWRFLRLHELEEPGGTVADLYRSYPSYHEDVREYAASSGVWVDETRYTRAWDPLLAHRLLAAVRDDGGDDLPSLWSLARVVFTANFVHGVEISDHAALRGAVERGGLHLPLRIWTLVASDDGHLDETLADRRRALEIGLDGVPRMYVGGRIVPTWIEHDEVRLQLRAAIEESAT